MQNCNYEYQEETFQEKVSGQLSDTAEKIYQELHLCHTNCGSVPAGLRDYFNKKTLETAMHTLKHTTLSWESLSYQQQQAVREHCLPDLLAELGFNPSNPPVVKPRPEFFSLDPEGF